MRAVLCKTFGPPESLVIEEVPSPELGAGQVRVKLVPSITVAKKGKTPTEVICELDAKAAREWLLADWSKYQERPSWFRRDCLAK